MIVKEIDLTLDSIPGDLSEYHTGVIYYDKKQNVRNVKCQIPDFDPHLNEFKDTLKWAMIYLDEGIYDLIKFESDRADIISKDMDELKEQYKESLGYDKMRAQLWCEMVKPKGIDEAYEALAAFDKTFVECD